MFLKYSHQECLNHIIASQFAMLTLMIEFLTHNPTISYNLQLIIYNFLRDKLIYLEDPILFR